MAEDKTKEAAQNAVDKKAKKLEKPKDFTVTEPFLYGDKRLKKGDKIQLQDEQMINNLTPKYIR